MKYLMLIFGLMAAAVGKGQIQIEDSLKISNIIFISNFSQ
jgi:hypothetical protein